jgi:hypothetical protein
VAQVGWAPSGQVSPLWQGELPLDLHLTFSMWRPVQSWQWSTFTLIPHIQRFAHRVQNPTQVCFIQHSSSIQKGKTIPRFGVRNKTCVGLSELYLVTPETWPWKLARRICWSNLCCGWKFVIIVLYDCKKMHGWHFPAFCLRVSPPFVWLSSPVTKEDLIATFDFYRQHCRSFSSCLFLSRILRMSLLISFTLHLLIWHSAKMHNTDRWSNLSRLIKMSPYMTTSPVFTFLELGEFWPFPCC